MARNITVTFDDGTSHVYANTPDEVTPAQVEQRASSEFNKKVVNIDGGAAPTPVAPPREPLGRVESATNLVAGAPERMATSIGERSKEMIDILQNKEFNFPMEKELQMVGKGVAGPVLDIGGEIVSTGVGAAADLINPEIRQGFNDLMKGIADSRFAQAAINTYKSLDANTQRTLDSIFNIGNVMSPFKVKPKQGTGLVAAIQEGTEIVPKKTELKKKMLERLFQPERSRANIEKELKYGVEALNEVVNDLMDAKGLSVMYSPERNIKALRGHQDKLEAKIKGQLANFDKTGVWVRDLRTSFNDLLKDTIQNDPVLRRQGLTANQISNLQAGIMRKLEGSIKNLKDKKIEPNSLRGLLEIRRELDKSLTDADFSKMGDSQKANLALEKMVLMGMRKPINKTVSNLVKQFDPENVTVQELLKKQSSAYVATENYIEKTSGQMADLSGKGAVAKALSSHPLLVYRSLQNSGTSPLLAGVLAAPSAINMLGETYGAGRRQLSRVPVPPVRAGLFYGQEEEQ